MSLIRRRQSMAVPIRVPVGAMAIDGNSIVHEAVVNSRLVEERRNRCDAIALHVQQMPFAFESAAVSSQASVRTDHPVARHDHADGVVPIGQADGSGGAW